MKKKKKLRYGTAQQWLNAAVKNLRPLFWKEAAILPTKIQVSVGWPTGETPGKAIGQAWSGDSYAKDRRTATIFIAPDVFKPLEVLEILVHELVHVAPDVECYCGHGPPFNWLAAAVGLERCNNYDGWAATWAGTDLGRELAKIAGRLGPYPWMPIHAVARGWKRP